MPHFAVPFFLLKPYVICSTKLEISRYIPHFAEVRCVRRVLLWSPANRRHKALRLDYTFWCCTKYWTAGTSNCKYMCGWKNCTNNFVQVCSRNLRKFAWIKRCGPRHRHTHTHRCQCCLTLAWTRHKLAQAHILPLQSVALILTFNGMAIPCYKLPDSFKWLVGLHPLRKLSC